VWPCPDSCRDGAQQPGAVNRLVLVGCERRGFRQANTQTFLSFRGAAQRNGAASPESIIADRGYGFRAPGPRGASAEPRNDGPASKQTELLTGLRRWGEMLRRQGAARLVEAELLAGKLETPADDPGNGSASGHALSPVRIVILAAAGLAD